MKQDSYILILGKHVQELSSMKLTWFDCQLYSGEKISLSGLRYGYLKIGQTYKVSEIIQQKTSLGKTMEIYKFSKL